MLNVYGGTARPVAQTRVTDILYFIMSSIYKRERERRGEGEGTLSSLFYATFLSRCDTKGEFTHNLLPTRIS